jgi:hypothetical protein
MLLMVGALGTEGDTSVSMDPQRHNAKRAPAYRIGILDYDLLLPSLASVRKDPTKGGPDPFMNVSSLHPFRFRNRLLGIQVDHQTQLGWELGGQQRWEHRVGFISLRGGLQRRVLLRSLRQYFNLDEINQNSQAEMVEW